VQLATNNKQTRNGISLARYVGQCERSGSKKEQQPNEKQKQMKNAERRADENGSPTSSWFGFGFFLRSVSLAGEPPAVGWWWAVRPQTNHSSLALEGPSPSDGCDIFSLPGTSG